MWARSSGDNHRLILAAIAALTLLPPPPAAQAQSVSMTLDDILVRLNENTKLYEAEVPNLSCDEHAVLGTTAASQNTPKKKPAAPQTTTSTTDSTFQLKRVSTSETTVSLVESRSVKTVNGQPSQGDDLSVPGLLNGAFSSALSIVSERDAPCVRMTLEPMQPEKPTAPYVINFTTAPKAERPDTCVLKDDGAGRIYVDSDSMQITRIEFNAPHHQLTNQVEMSYGRPVRAPTGVWNISIDYAGVTLGKTLFWLPSAVNGTLSGGTVPTVWTFQAQYTNFRKLEAAPHPASPPAPNPQKP